jgi:hypothetical protein
MIVLKKKFTRYHTYANATLDEMLTPQQLKSAQVLSAITFEHTMLTNEAGKHFRSDPLPRPTQVSTLRAIKVLDLNEDGNADLIVGGNFYGTDAQFGRHDASVGSVLLGDGKGEFRVVPSDESGLNMKGNVRSVALVNAADSRYLYVARNSERSSLLRMK